MQTFSGALVGLRGSSLILDPACALHAFIREHLQRRLVRFGHVFE
jgi:hypothetical protein